jgi:hypothetical protein
MKEIKGYKDANKKRVVRGDKIEFTDLDDEKTYTVKNIKQAGYFIEVSFEETKRKLPGYFTRKLTNMEINKNKLKEMYK